MLQRNIFTEEQSFFRQTVSKFVEKEILPHHNKWETEGRVPKDL